MINGSQTYRKLVQSTIIAEGVWWLLVAITLFLLTRVFSIKFGLLHTNYLWLWLVIPVFTIGNVLLWKWKANLYDQYSGEGKTRMLWITFESRKTFLHYFLLRSVFFFIVLGLAQPIQGNQKVKGSKRILDLVICLDISNSMNTQDMNQGSVSRLTAAKNAISELLNQLKGERIAVVVFANGAYTQLPLTMDYGAAKLFVPDIETSMISDQGTNIGNALLVAQEQFKDQESGRAILVITDGEDHEQLWQEQVQILKEQNITLAYLGLGTASGGLIPNDPEDPNAGYKRENGTAVVSKLDKSALKQMGNNSNADVYVSSSAFPDVVPLANNFSNVKNKTLKALEFTVAKNYFELPVIGAICCFLAYLFLPIFVNRQRS